MFGSYRILFQCLVLLALFGCQNGSSIRYCAIQVVDSDTGEGIPAIRLQSLNRASYITDSDGYIAYYEPGLMGRDLYFEVDAEGYRIESDVTGRMATTLKVDPESEVTLKMKRIQPAERLHRLTGHGIYRDSYLLGKDAPVSKSVLNGNVLGQDSNLGVIYKSKIFWIWGDTFLPSEYKGNFSVSAAVSELPGAGGLDPAVGINYEYFTDQNGSSKPMIELEGQGYTWFEWLLNIPDDEGNERLVGKYARVGGMWQNYERGIAIFNDDTEVFERHSNSDIWLPGFAIMNHPIRVRMKESSMFYMTAEYDFQRVAASLDSVASPTAYEVFTCLSAGATYDPSGSNIERDQSGSPIYSWKKGTATINSERQVELIDNGAMKQEDAWLQLRNVLTNEPHQIRRGSIQWNDFRQKWILIAQGGGNYFGDAIYSEADSPIGPWAYATVVAQHDNLFYNPVHHPFFDRGDTIFFEGTYTNFWNQGQTKEYYDYNQLQYQLKLSHPDALIPSAVYRLNNGDLALSRQLEQESRWDEVSSVAFYAFEAALHPEEAIPVFKTFENGQTELSVRGSGDPFVYGLPASTESYSSFEGKWEIALKGYEAIDAYLPLVVTTTPTGLQATTTSKTFTIEEVEMEGANLIISISQYGKNYRLQWPAQDQVPGQMTGEWVKLSPEGDLTGWKGQVEGTLVSEKWLTKMSNGLRSISSAGSVTSGNGVFRAWPNPHSQLFLDPTVVPDDLP